MRLSEIALHALVSRKQIGTVVAIDPRNGEILAMVSTPSYNPESLSSRKISSELWSSLIENPDKPLRNRALQDVYPPGSTFKPLVALAALSESGNMSGGSVDCHGGMKFGNRLYHCWHAHGAVDLMKAIQVSCDTYFYQLGLKLGVDTLSKYARLFGLGEKTGVALSGEQRGLIPDSVWKLKTYGEPWQPGETLTVSIGQGFVSVTPLQLAAAYATIANGGKLFRPQLRADSPPDLKAALGIPAHAFEVVQEGLRRTINDPIGTGYRTGRSQYVDISGKTGTAQVRNFANIATVRCESLPRQFRHHAWFAGYAPSQKPTIALAVLVEHGCHGAASPLAKEILENYLAPEKQKKAPTRQMANRG